MEMNETLELLDLEELVTTAKEEVRQCSKTSEYELSTDFQNALTAAFPDYTFYYYERTLKVDTPSGQFIYVSNQSFALARRLMTYCAEIGKYRGIARDIFNKNKDKLKNNVPQNGKLEDEVFTDLRDQKNDLLKKEFESETKAYFREKCRQNEELVNENTERLIRFATDYQWWLGGKQISRSNDWAISPISTLLNMPQNDSNFVARAVSKATEDSDYRKAFEHAIDKEWEDSGNNTIQSVTYKTGLNSKYERNRILFGAPGTGKSFSLKNDCNKLMTDTAGTYERVTFHPDYSYSQFVGTYKPVMDTDGKSIKYDFVPGPFMRIYVDALKSGRTEAPQPHLLIIEEINRAKVAAVFGDVFQLLDRDDDGVSEYEIQASEDIRRYLASKLGGDPDNYRKIRIPDNMFIWATMNSADQGVYPMDTAFKRRWDFEYLGINENEEKITSIGNIRLSGTDEVLNWNTLRKAINAKMSSDEFRINEDKLMGPFFLSKKIIMSDESGAIVDQDKFIKAFKSKVIMYLYEDAVKQRKHNFFSGCDSSKYSSVCDAFDENGIEIFGANFKELYYDRQRNDA